MSGSSKLWDYDANIVIIVLVEYRNFISLQVLLASKAAAGINIVVINPARGTAGSVHNFDSFQNSGWCNSCILRIIPVYSCIKFDSCIYYLYI